ncbi:MAG: hypothetical protein LLG42_01560 [Chloroflexi bacterium]|nr:hypothetical protein [Chloroflexota bacterium]
MKSALRMTPQNTNLQNNGNGQTDSTQNGVRLFPMTRIRIGLTLTLIGFMMFLLGARPALFGLDRSPVIGFVQIAVFTVGLGGICIGGYISLMALWKNESPSIAADFGLRFVATGFVVAVFSGMADIFGFGSHPLPGIPYFGIWQARGVLVGEMIIGFGFLLLIPYRYIFPSKPTASEKTESSSKTANETDDETGAKTPGE